RRHVGVYAGSDGRPLHRCRPQEHQRPATTAATKGQADITPKEEGRCLLKVEGETGQQQEQKQEPTQGAEEEGCRRWEKEEWKARGRRRWWRRRRRGNGGKRQGLHICGGVYGGALSLRGRA
ncbi:unnamed protein product, partial [Ectocarpus sp. 12 AP-2014]